MKNEAINKIYKKYNVNLSGNKYDILLGNHILSSIVDFVNRYPGDKKILIVVDDVFNDSVMSPLVDDLNKNDFTVHVYNFKAGKNHKNINETLALYEILEINNYARDSIMIAVGGGVIGDLSGFVASTYFRGMNFIQVPTTLTGMIDSSIGGKVAINFRKTINAIGNYYHPILNVIDLQFISTLPQRDFKAGLSEIIKCSVINDKDLFYYLVDKSHSILSHDLESMLHVFYRAIEIKLFHVHNDIEEAGKRLKLNYGHTLGHAVEVSTGVFEEIYRHGEGVSIGMMGAAYIAKIYFNQNNDIIDAHKSVLIKYDLPTYVNASEIGFQRDVMIRECLKNIFKDKKRKGNRLRFILPISIGRSVVVDDVSDEMIKQAFEYLIRE